MINESNLIPLNKRTKEEQRAIQVKGGKASGRSRKKKKELKELFKEILNMPLTDGELSKIKNLRQFEGANVTVEQAICIAQIKKAIKGDINSFNAIIEIAELMKKEEDGKDEDNSFMRALEAEAAEVWKDDK